MRRSICLLFPAVLAISSIEPVHAAYLEVGPGSAPPDGVVLPPGPRPILPPPIPPDPGGDDCRVVLRRLRGLGIGAPVTWGALPVFPLTGADAPSSARYLSMDEAFERGVLSISESGSGIVSRLVARNRSGQYVLLLAGDLLVGGKQNRALQRDVLLPPRSSTPLSVACVEQHRWSGGTDEFRMGPGLAAGSVRRSVLEGGSQEEVWTRVREANRALGADPGTGSHAAAYDSPGSRIVLDEAGEAFRGFRRPGQVGAVFCYQDSIVGVEVFAGSRLFERNWDRLFRSYVLDCPVPGGEWRWPPRMSPPSVSDVERFLAEAQACTCVREPGAGAGTALHLMGSVDGKALVHRGEAVHILLYRAFRLYSPRPGLR